MLSYHRVASRVVSFDPFQCKFDLLRELFLDLTANAIANGDSVDFVIGDRPQENAKTTCSN